MLLIISNKLMDSAWASILLNEFAIVLDRITTINFKFLIKMEGGFSFYFFIFVPILSQ